MTIKIFVPVALSLIALNTFAGQDRGGGDLCENRIKIIRDDLTSWIKQDGAKDLVLPAGLSKERYDAGMLSAMSTTKIRCVGEGNKDYPVEVYGTPKVCRFDRNMFNQSTITCSRPDMSKLTEDEQYVLIHHEFAGLAGFEVPSRDDSNYELSNQLSSFLVDQRVRRLAVKPRQSEQPQWVELSGKEGVEVAAALNDAFKKTNFTDCDVEFDPYIASYPESIRFSCDGEDYESQRYSIARKVNPNIKFYHIYAGAFECDSKVRSNFLYRDQSGKRVKWVYDNSARSKESNIVEVVYELDHTGLGISKANYTFAETLKVNRGSIAKPNWVYERQTKQSFQCNSKP